MKTVVVGYSEA
uniref:Uncharacterized protein n=1 Tax=Leersia perrieri TaxID=77586 RepID=A0A0D9VEG2_9ORYZ